MNDGSSVVQHKSTLILLYIKSNIKQSDVDATNKTLYWLLLFSKLVHPCISTCIYSSSSACQ